MNHTQTEVRFANLAEFIMAYDAHTVSISIEDDNASLKDHEMYYPDFAAYYKSFTKGDLYAISRHHEDAAEAQKCAAYRKEALFFSVRAERNWDGTFNAILSAVETISDADDVFGMSFETTEFCSEIGYTEDELAELATDLAAIAYRGTECAKEAFSVFGARKLADHETFVY